MALVLSMAALVVFSVLTTGLALRVGRGRRP